MKKTIIFADRRQTMSCIDIGLNSNSSGCIPGDNNKRQKSSNVFENKGAEGVVHKKNANAFTKGIASVHEPQLSARLHQTSLQRGQVIGLKNHQQHHDNKAKSDEKKLSFCGRSGLCKITPTLRVDSSIKVVVMDYNRHLRESYRMLLNF